MLCSVKRTSDQEQTFWRFQEMWIKARKSSVAVWVSPTVLAVQLGVEGSTVPRCAARLLHYSVCRLGSESWSSPAAGQPPATRPGVCPQSSGPRRPPTLPPLRRPRHPRPRPRNHPRARQLLSYICEMCDFSECYKAMWKCQRLKMAKILNKEPAVYKTEQENFLRELRKFHDSKGWVKCYLVPQGGVLLCAGAGSLNMEVAAGWRCLT